MALYELDGVRVAVPSNGRYWVAPNAAVIGRVQLDEEASVWFGATVRGDNELIHIGARSNVQDGATLHTDLGYPLTIGVGCTIGHGAILHGCTIGDGALIGMGATILNGATIGAGAVIGANALIAEGKDIPPGALAVGAPARVIRELTDEQQAGFARLGDGYVKNWQRFKAGMRPQPE
ncbi:MAG: gamma carbonic anhydrase family protein [Pseudomonadota bacterium]